MAGVDQPLQAIRAAVGVPRGEEVDAVVAPAEPAGEVGHRHQLDVGDAQPLEVVEPVDDRLEGPLLR